MPASTLIIGIGGQGGKVIERIAKSTTLEDSKNVAFMVMDTDVNDLERIHRRDTRIRIVQTSYRATVGGALETNKSARDGWFPSSHGILRKSLTEGAGQVRAISRLAFDHAIKCGKMAELEECIAELRSLRGDPREQSMRVMICGSIAGGTGSGLALPLALYIRNYLQSRYDDNSAVIRGFFLQPDCLFGSIGDEEERNMLRCNAYAVIREIDAFIRKGYLPVDEYPQVVFNAPQPGEGDRVDYPNLLPYDYVFMMDAVNVDGEHLHGIDDYIKHMADIIHSQTIGTTAAAFNQQEDNVLRRLDMSKGRARYCGAGCSHLVYPYEEVRRYFGIRWSEASISNEWLELDKRYRQEIKDGDILDSPLARAKSFVNTFDILRDQNDMFAALGRETVITIRETTRDGDEIVREKSIGEDYLECLDHFAYEWSKNGLTRECQRLRDIDEQHMTATVPNSSMKVEQRAKNLGEGWSGRIADQYGRFEKRNRDLFEIVTGEEPKLTKTHAERMFKIREDDENPLKTMNDTPFIEHYISKHNGTGGKHPLVVRHILYSALIALEDAIDKKSSDCEGHKASILDDFETYFQADADGKSAQLEGEEESKSFFDPVLRLIGKGGKINEETAGKLAKMGQGILDTRDEVDSLRAMIAEIEVYRAAKEHVEQLISAYEGFFNYLEGQIPELASSAEDIELRSDFNSRTGSPTLYVCASKKCLEQLYDRCPQGGSSANLPAELCADIFRGVARYIALSEATKTQLERNKAGKTAFETLFKRTFIDFWTMRLEDPAFGYSSVVDKTVLAAIIDEAKCNMPPYIHSDDEVETYLRGYLVDVIKEAYDLAKPYIKKPQEGSARWEASHKGSCIYARGVVKGLGSFARAARECLEDVRGIEVLDDEVSVHELVFSRAVYGFTAEQLPNYACERYGKVYHRAGEYHRAYWNLVSVLSPSDERNNRITPHIDKRWHLISYLPDISDDFQRKLRREIARAFFFGLSYESFGDNRGRDGSYVFHLKGERDMGQIELMVPDGSKCDRFHKLFEALKFDPQVVAELNRRFDESINAELNGYAGGHMQSCALVHNTRTKAFVPTSRFSTQKVVEAIQVYGQDTDSLKGAGAYNDQTSTQFLTHCATHFFKVSQKDGLCDLVRIPHSIFEIPLYYSISIPPKSLRIDEIENMTDDICFAVLGYMRYFAQEDDLVSYLEDFFREQYLLFEYNLVTLDKAYPGSAYGSVVSIVREKVLSCFAPYGQNWRDVRDAQEQITDEWNAVQNVKNSI